MEKSKLIGYALASVVCVIMMIVLLFASIYPCGYWDQAQLYEDEGFAGHGYHSFVDVVGNGFFWEADEAPESYDLYRGDGPYYAMGLWWISLLYVPIFLGIFYLGIILAGYFENRFEGGLASA